MLNEQELLDRDFWGIDSILMQQQMSKSWLRMRLMNPTSGVK